MRGGNKQSVLVLAIFIHQIAIRMMIRYFAGISDVGHLISLPKFVTTEELLR